MWLKVALDLGGNYELNYPQHNGASFVNAFIELTKSSLKNYKQYIAIYTTYLLRVKVHHRRSLPDDGASSNKHGKFKDTKLVATFKCYPNGLWSTVHCTRITVAADETVRAASTSETP